MSSKAKRVPKSKDELRSHFPDDGEQYLPSDTPPCSAPDGYSWVRAFSPEAQQVNRLDTGKWLIHVSCGEQVDYCWARVRLATEDGALGVAAKVSTDWGRENDPTAAWGNHVHVICVFTRDWLDLGDVRRVAKRLAEIDAVRKLILQYKPDILTRIGVYEDTTPGRVAVYSCRPPYDELTLNHAAIDSVKSFVAYAPAEMQLRGVQDPLIDWNATERILSRVLGVFPDSISPRRGGRRRRVG